GKIGEHNEVRSCPDNVGSIPIHQRALRITARIQMPEKVTIPISYFQYDADYVRPLVSIWMDRANLVQAIFDALLPWQLEIDNVEPITTGKASEQGIKIKLPQKRVTLFFGPAACRFSRDNADWATAGEVIEILRTFLTTLTNASGAELANQKTLIALHLQPRSTTFVKLLKPFLSPEVQGLSQDEVTSGACVVKWKNRRVTVDGSAAIANALYLKLDREFEPTVSFEDMAIQLKSDEDSALQLLGVEEDVS
ncbi:MAG: hypothetical protein WBD32_12915, partial [Acidobacteriaceae bacterium]